MAQSINLHFNNFICAVRFCCDFCCSQNITHGAIREYVPSDSCKIKEVSAGPGMTWLFPRSSDVGWEAGCRMKQYEAKNARTHKIAIRINAFLDRARWGCRATRKRCSNIFLEVRPTKPMGILSPLGEPGWIIFLMAFR